ncbi:MAG TPA: lysophospholipase [Clostridiales bacterium]|jgi:lysophospholipase L1-like esterase|nr:lysophospholipase [Clostridiales bacterium]HCG35865.1 lysophospholipase [Clostridiales bacterium]
MKTVLFQGDSITDAGRARDGDVYNRGYGYATMVSGLLGWKYPGTYNGINRGISGNRVVDLYARIKLDCINLNPDYISILIGINDVWHEVANKNGVSADKFVKVYSMLIEETQEALPHTKIMILEPFVLHGLATDAAWDYFETETRLRGEGAKKVADTYGLPFITLQDKFNRALDQAPASFWLKDGVHPNAPGHMLIANAWMDMFEQIK